MTSARAKLIRKIHPRTSVTGPSPISRFLTHITDMKKALGPQLDMGKSHLTLHNSPHFVTAALARKNGCPWLRRVCIEARSSSGLVTLLCANVLAVVVSFSSTDSDWGALRWPEVLNCAKITDGFFECLTQFDFLKGGISRQFLYGLCVLNL